MPHSRQDNSLSQGSHSGSCNANGHAQLSVAILSVATLRPHYVLMLPEGRVPSLRGAGKHDVRTRDFMFFFRSVDSLKQSHLHALDDPCVDVAR